ncbi:MAG: flagellar biosynthesis protein FlhA [Phycisphaerae bacterium]|nr:flagellar biosynthesis protein FlhA [Phycisphaerae bacterium]
MALALPHPLRLLQAAATHRSLLLPMAAMSLLLVILIPLPPWLMDFLLSTNIAVAAIILMTVMYIASPLEFSSFPSMLLGVTLFRLVLNIATTRLILSNATEGTAAAGKVIETFGEFVAGGQLMIGVILFAIIIIIQFVVITKGATRIAEVAARFTLDGMPGKQMAIDADLNAGIISESEAKARREEITRESDFYGAMDGASKFVRGDAVAGLIITVVNILGGIYVGLIELDMSFMDTLSTFSKLTIGDGLSSQIPALLVSVAAAMLVTRSASKTNLGDELLGQLTSHPVALALTAAFLILLIATPMPKMPLIGLGFGCASIAWFLRRSQAAAVVAEATRKRAATPSQERIEKYLSVDPMELEIGYGLIGLVDRKQGGDLLDRITNLRRQIAQEMGIVVPPIRIRDNVQLQPNEYRIKLKGMDVAPGDLMPGHVLAIDSGTVTQKVAGVEAREPAFGLPALWITNAQRHDAEHRNYTVVEPTAVLATHLTEIIKQHADELLTRQEVNRLLDTLRERSPKLVEELVPTVVKPGEIQNVLQALLRERVPVRDLETVLETLGDWVGRTRDVEILTEYVRNSLARTICQMHRAADGKLHCVTLDPQLEHLISAGLDRTDRGTLITIPPATQARIVDAVRQAVEQALPACQGQTPLILCSPQIRVWVRRLIEPSLPLVSVLSYNEIVRGVQLESHGMVVVHEGS